MASSGLRAACSGSVTTGMASGPRTRGRTTELAAESREMGAGSGPSRDGAVRGQSEQLDGALVTSAKDGNVRRPGEALSVVARELCLNDDTEHGLSVDEQHDSIGAELGRDDLGQIGGSEPCLCVSGQLEVQSLAKQLRGELGLVAEEQDERLVIKRRHRRRR